MRRVYMRQTDAQITYCRDPYGFPACEHCDGDRSPLIRRDDLRGWVCKACDSSLDAMYPERAASGGGK